MSNNSYIEVTQGSATTFSGPDAVRLYRAVMLRSAINLHDRTGMLPNRMFTPTNMLIAAGQITGKAYKRGKVGRAAAMADLTAWINAMQSALPVVDGNRVSLANMNPAAMAAAARNAKRQ